MCPLSLVVPLRFPRNIETCLENEAGPRGGNRRPESLEKEGIHTGNSLCMHRRAACKK